MSFVESATLKVVDQATANINKINAALKRLQATAKQLEKLNLGGVGALGRSVGVGGQGNARFQRQMRDQEGRTLRDLGYIRGLQIATEKRRLDEAVAGVRLQQRLRAAEERRVRVIEQTAARESTARLREMGQSIALRQRTQRQMEREARRAELKQYAQAKDMAYVAKHAFHEVGVPYSGAAATFGALAAASSHKGLAPVLGGALGAAAGLGLMGATLKKAGDRDLILKKLNLLGYNKEDVIETIDGKGTRRFHDVKWTTDAQGRRVPTTEHGLHEDEKVTGAGTAMEMADRVASRITSRYTNVSKTEALELQQKLTSIMGTSGHATEVLEPLSRLTSFLKSYDGKKHGEFMTEVRSAAVSAELQGLANTPEDMTKYLTDIAALKVSSAGNISIKDFLQAQRLARASFLNLRDEYRMGILPAYVQEYGASAGVQLATSFRAHIGGKKLSKDEIGMLSKYGLLDMSGGRAKFKTGDLATRDPFIASMQEADQIMRKEVGGKSLFKKGYKIGDMLEYSDIDKERLKELLPKMREILPKIMARMLGDRTAADLALKPVLQGPKFIKDQELAARVRQDMAQLGDTDFHTMRTMPGALAAIQAQWDNLLSAFVTNAPVAIAALNGVAKALNLMAQGIEASPTFATFATLAGTTAAGVMAMRLLKWFTAGPGLAAGGAALKPGAAALTGLMARSGGILGGVMAGTAAAGAVAAKSGMGAQIMKSLGLGAGNAPTGFLGKMAAWGARLGLAATSIEAFKSFKDGKITDAVSSLALGLASLTGPMGMIGSLGVGALWGLTGRNPFQLVGDFFRWLTGGAAQAAEAGKQASDAVSQSRDGAIPGALQSVTSWFNSFRDKVPELENAARGLTPGDGSNPIATAFDNIINWLNSAKQKLDDFASNVGAGAPVPGSPGAADERNIIDRAMEESLIERELRRMFPQGEDEGTGDYLKRLATKRRQWIQEEEMERFRIQEDLRRQRQGAETDANGLPLQPQSSSPATPLAPLFDGTVFQPISDSFSRGAGEIGSAIEQGSGSSGATMRDGIISGGQAAAAAMAAAIAAAVAGASIQVQPAPAKPSTGPQQAMAT